MQILRLFNLQYGNRWQAVLIRLIGYATIDSLPEPLSYTRQRFSPKSNRSDTGVSRAITLRNNLSENYKIQQALSNPGDSAMRRYMKLVFGQESVTRLFLFELVMLLGGKRSGALGLVLRKTMYPWILGSVGRNVVFGANISLRHPHKVHIADGVVIDDNVMLDAKGESNQGIRLDEGVFIGRNTILSCKNGDIHLEKNANLGFNCLLTSTNSITVGADNIVAAFTYILGGGNYQIDNIDRPIREMYDYQGKGGVVTGENVWIGAHVTVLDGVRIGSGAVVGAGSVVSRSIPDNAVAAGAPAEVRRQRET